MDVFSELSMLQGQDVIIQFEHQNEFGCFPINLDDISLQVESVELSSPQASSIPEIPTMYEWGVIHLFLILTIVCCLYMDEQKNGSVEILVYQENNPN